MIRRNGSILGKINIPTDVVASGIWTINKARDAKFTSTWPFPTATTINYLLVAGGGSGGYVRAYINSPSASYAYSVGAGGTAGTVGSNGQAGTAGTSGIVIITAYF